MFSKCICCVTSPIVMKFNYYYYYFWFFIMFIVAMKETKLLIIMMDFGIKDGVFQTKVFNRYGAFDWITNESMKGLGYIYLHCLTTIILIVKIASYKNAWTTFVKGHVCEGQKLWHLIKIEKGIEKGDMHIVVTISLIIIMSSIFWFQLELVHICSTWIPLGNWKALLKVEVLLSLLV